jgi:hypothetical protein
MFPLLFLACVHQGRDNFFLTPKETYYDEIEKMYVIDLDDPKYPECRVKTATIMVEADRNKVTLACGMNLYELPPRDRWRRAGFVVTKTTGHPFQVSVNDEPSCTGKSFQITRTPDREISAVCGSYVVLIPPEQGNFLFTVDRKP